MTRDISELPQPDDRLYPIRVVPIRTFILQGHSKDAWLRMGVVVPSFASHGGVVVSVQDALTLYRSVFDHSAPVPDEATPDTVKGKIRRVKFHHVPSENNSGES